MHARRPTCGRLIRRLWIPSVLIPAFLIVVLFTAAAPVSSAPPEARTRTDLSLTRWKLRTLGSAAALPGVSATLLFGATNEFGGSDGCNSFSGSFRQDDSRISLKPGRFTLIACPEPVMNQARAFSRALVEAQTFTATLSELILEDRTGQGLARFEALPVLGLAGTPWVARGIHNGRGGVVSSRWTPRATATFSKNGELAGLAGCNRFTAAYSMDGEHLRITGLVVTAMRCPEPELMELQAQFLTALTRTTRFRLTENALELRDDTGALQVRFGPAP